MKLVPLLAKVPPLPIATEPLWVTVSAPMPAWPTSRKPPAAELPMFHNPPETSTLPPLSAELPISA